MLYLHQESIQRKARNKLKRLRNRPQRKAKAGRDSLKTNLRSVNGLLLRLKDLLPQMPALQLKLSSKAVAKSFTNKNLV
jgi:hypothetical protein